MTNVILIIFLGYLEGNPNLQVKDPRVRRHLQTPGILSVRLGILLDY